MTIGSLGYVVNDALVRLLTERGPGVYQVLFLRSIGLAVLFALVGRFRNERNIRGHIERPLLVRVGAEMVGSALFFAAIIRIEFANAQAILQLIPFAVTLAAALILKERVTGRQYLTVLIGFVGVVLVVRPATDAFSAWSLMAVASAAFMVLREFATRDGNPATPATTIAFVTAVGLAVLTGMLSIPSGWTGFGFWGAVLLSLSTASLFVGYLFTIETVRIGDLSVSAPFRYTLLIGAVALGYVFFDEVPDLPTIVGSAIIIVSGIYALRLERKTSAAAPASQAS
jgi:drug/metabolite transporter (DMT)-like permease